jgi:hypothetical protein
MVVFDPVPVELISFTAEVLDQKVSLRWETATETNNKGFEIERCQVSNVRGETVVGKTNWINVGYVDGFGTRSEKTTYSFIDDLTGAQGAGVSYRLKQIDYDGTFNYSDVVELEILPSVYSLEQNYPNPFNPVTTFKFSLPHSSNVKLVVYNSLGEAVTELINDIKEGGYYQFEWNAGNVPSGIYIYRLEAQSLEGGNFFTDVKKMILLK